MINACRELGDCGCFKNALDWYVQFVDLTQSRQQLNRQQRVAAELEKLVMDANRLDAQQVLPNFGDCFLGTGRGRYKLRAELRSGVRRYTAAGWRSAAIS